MLVKLKNTHAACEVSGAMAAALRVQRLFGLAPLSISRVRDGVYCIGHSRIVLILSSILILLINVVVVYLFLDVILWDISESTSVSMLVKVCKHTALVTPIITVTNLAICSANRRMDNLMSILNQTRKIRVIIRYDGKTEPTSRLVMVTSFGFFILNLIMYVFDLILVNPSTNILYGNIDYNTSIYFKTIIDIGYSIILALQLQYLFFATILRLTVESLNYRLKQLFLYGDSRRTTRRRQYIRNLSRSYLSICELIIELVQAEGLLLIMILFTCIIRIFVTTYSLWFIYNKLTSSNYFKQKFSLELYALTIQSIHVVLLIEPFHRLVNEMEKPKVVISCLIRTLPRSSVLHTELDILQKLLLKQPSITPLGLFEFNRSLIATIAGYVVTFLLISNQYEHSN